MEKIETTEVSELDSLELGSEDHPSRDRRQVQVWNAECHGLLPAD
jgi:hypothetical protein